MVGRAGGAATFPLTLLTDPGLPLIQPVADFVVGVIDTGVVSFDGQPHPYLSGHLTDDWDKNVDQLTGPRLPGTADGHGTFVAGLILQQAPTARICMRNTLDGAAGGSDESVAAAIESMAWVDDLKLVNLSFFGSEFEDPPQQIEAALRALLDGRPDLVVVTAAGNSGTTKPFWPSAFSFPRLVSIGAVDETVVPASRPTSPPEAGASGAAIPPIASFSNHGLTVDAYAGGVSVLGPRFTDNDGTESPQPGWCRWSGTSFAAAAVTGRIAQVMIKMQVDARQAFERVLTLEDPLASGSAPTPLVPVPGAPPELWRPYIRTGNPDWG